MRHIDARGFRFVDEEAEIALIQPHPSFVLAPYVKGAAFDRSQCLHDVLQSHWALPDEK